MRVFIYTTKVISTSRKYRYQKIEARIYEVINNIPCIVLKVDEKGNCCSGAVKATWQTNSYMGEESEVYQALSKANVIPHVPPNEYYTNTYDNPNIKIFKV